MCNIADTGCFRRSLVFIKSFLKIHVIVNMTGLVAGQGLAKE
jgi:hypothetical protein